MKRVLCVVLLAAAWTAQARDLAWQPFGALNPGDRSYAEHTLYDLFGPDPEQWPDWVDAMALYAPTSDGDRMMIVRRPVHEPCGQYRFTIFGTVTPDHTREKWGDFCGGHLEVIKAQGRTLPDLLLQEGRAPDNNGDWQRQDLRLRWNEGQWWRVSN